MNGLIRDAADDAYQAAEALLKENRHIASAAQKRRCFTDETTGDRILVTVQVGDIPDEDFEEN